MASRRQFIAGAAAALAATTVPLPVIAAASEVAVPEAPKLLAFAFGTEEAFNWQPIFATSIEEATKLIRAEEGFFEDDENFPYQIQRVAKWDKRGEADNVTPADWIRAGMGHTCDRCSEELHDGGDPYPFILGEQVVCGECLTFAERVQHDRDQLIDEIANHIIDDGEDEARNWYADNMDVVAALWPEAVEMARKWA